MAWKRTLRTIAMACVLLASGMVFDGTLFPWPSGALVVNDAQARVGRPLTPVSYAGVARRTTRRRMIRRSTLYVAALPVHHCTQVNIEGTILHECGGTYYQASGAQYVVVYVD
jgi:hypothetical protein